MQPVKPKRGRPSTRHLKEFAQKMYPNFPKASQQKTFYAQYGKTISTWQFVEMGLYRVYSAVIGAARYDAQAAAFHSIQGFRTQLNITNAAVRFAFHNNEKLLEEWKALYNRADDKSLRRNQIAHGMVYREFKETDHERKVYVAPVMSDTRNKLPSKKPKCKPEPLTLKRLKGYENDFRNLAQAMREFSQRIPQP